MQSLLQRLLQRLSQRLLRRRLRCLLRRLLQYLLRRMRCLGLSGASVAADAACSMDTISLLRRL
jgi:hypothetical protein